jgi:hypothetical protein
VGPAEPIASQSPVLHVFGADLDGDGTPELGTVQESTAQIGEHAHELTGEFQQALTVPSQKGDRVWLAEGQGRANRDAPIRVTEISASGSRLLFERQGERDQLTDLRFVDGRVWTVMYANSKQTAGGWLTGDGFEPVTLEHMAQRQVPLPDGSTIVGRVYGVAPKSPGDLRRVAPSGEATPLSSLRGVRALARVDLNADGHDDIVSGDGWHYAYGKEGDARVVLHIGPDFTESRVIGWVPDSYAALHMEPVGTGTRAALVVQGSHRVVLMSRDGLGWGVQDLGPVPEVGSIAVLQPESAPRVAISGPDARVVPLQWTTP